MGLVGSRGSISITHLAGAFTPIERLQAFAVSRRETPASPADTVGHFTAMPNLPLLQTIKAEPIVLVKMKHALLGWMDPPPERLFELMKTKLII